MPRRRWLPGAGRAPPLLQPSRCRPGTATWPGSPRRWRAGPSRRGCRGRTSRGVPLSRTACPPRNCRAPPGIDRTERLWLGLLDRPDAQTQEPLELDLARAGGWLAVGGPRSGRTTFLRTALAEAVTALGPDRLHVHVLDHGGGGLAAVVGGLPHTGTAVGGDDALRTVRLLDRLAQEVAARRAAPSGNARPHLLLLVDGVESVMAQLDESDPGRGSAALLRLVRDGGAAGLTCLLTADRAVPGGRLANAVNTRLVLPLSDRADYAVVGIPARDVPGHRPPGRALVGEDARECQLALPRRLPTTWPDAALSRNRPLSVPELPAAPVLPLPVPTGSDHPLRLPVGPGGDGGGVLTVDLARTGGLLVAGPPGSGRTTALESCARHLAAAGVAVLHIVRGARQADAGTGPGRRLLDATDVGGWQEWLAGLHGTPGAVLVDDSAVLADSAVLGALTAVDAVPDVVLVFAGTAAELSAAFRGPVPALRRRRSGLLLSPGPGDADLLGIRLPRTPVPTRPGSGWLVVAGSAQRVQVARRHPPEGTPVLAPAGSGACGAAW
jgi:S-DNA-T family DNA segregation ATPase FtsK/SpoIIIE